MSRDTSTDDQSAAERGLFPVRPLWFKIGFYLFLLLWLGYMIWETTSYTEFEDYFFPYLLGVPLVLLILLQLFILQYPEAVETALPEEEVASHESEDEIEARVEAAQTTHGRESKAEKETYELYMIAWVTLLPFMMYFVGMGWTMIVYVFAFTMFFTRSLKWSAIMTVTVTAFVYILFIHLLGMIIWTGTLPVPDPLEQLDQALYLGRML